MRQPIQPPNRRLRGLQIWSGRFEKKKVYIYIYIYIYTVFARVISAPAYFAHPDF